MELTARARRGCGMAGRYGHLREKSLQKVANWCKLVEHFDYDVKNNIGFARHALEEKFIAAVLRLATATLRNLSRWCTLM